MLVSWIPSASDRGRATREILLLPCLNASSPLAGSEVQNVYILHISASRVVFLEIGSKMS